MDLGPIRSYEPAEIDGEARDASVLIPVFDRSEPHLLFTKRAEHLSDHPGQMSFPGGGREPEDEDRKATALREANEEIGLRPEEVEIHGRLDDFVTITDYAVRPFVGTIPDRTYAPGDGEVAEIAVLPLSDLLDQDNYESERREHPRYGNIRLHYFHVGGYTVWGATANILVQFLDLATDWTTPSKVDRVVDHDADFPMQE